MKKINIIFVVFLIMVFIIGIYMYSSKKLDKLFDSLSMENMENANPSKEGQKEKPCPDLLIRRGNTLLLYNSKLDIIDGINPLPFYNLDEYINYLEVERKKGRDCPVLFLQHETTTQGNDVYRMRPSPFHLDAGLMPLSAAAMVGKPEPRIPERIIDSNRDYPPFNAGNYPGFDPQGLMNGVYTKLDEVHDATSKNPDGQTYSDNPMDSNWGGVLYTQGKIDSGKYDDNNITRPIFANTKNTEFIPGLFGHSAPPSEFSQPIKV
jgi:hypothetical protein